MTIGEIESSGGSTRPERSAVNLATPAKNPAAAVYVDSPVISAIQQIRPFYESGIFSRQETPLMLRKWPMLGVQAKFSRDPARLASHASYVGKSAKFPVQPGGVVFYPFNSQSNLGAVADRDIFHVLTLHGESNKAASQRPAARLYDYITVAGPLARDRYLNAKIFSRTEVDRGRVVMTGDSFIQQLPWLKPSDGEEAAVLYSPTWEGYRPGQDCYTSLVGRRGFAVLRRIIALTGRRNIIIKPHPYLGLLRPSLVGELVAGVRDLQKKGARVRLALSDANMITRAACLLGLPNVPRQAEDSSQPAAIFMGITDVSGMEAILLKQGIRHMVITRSTDVPDSLGDFYLKKTISDDLTTDQKIQAYLENSEEIDLQHRNRVFGYQEPALQTLDMPGRRAWLTRYVQQDFFWSGIQRLS